MAKPLELNFTTILKLWALKEPALYRELQKYLTPGGYDFYRTLKRATASVCLDKITLDEARADLQQIKHSIEKKHNVAAFEKFVLWLSGAERTFLPPPKEVYPFGSGGLSIRIRPEIRFMQEGEDWALHIWNTLKPELTPDIYGLGAFLMQRALKSPSLRVGIFNLRDGKIYDYRFARNFTDGHLDARLQKILSAWISLQ